MQAISIPVKYIDTIKYKVTLWQDEWSESPTEWGNFKIVQFRDNDFDSYQELESSEFVTENGFLTPATLAKLKAGKMFTIDYRRYSNADGGHYSLDGSIPRGQVDSQDVNGFIIFDDAYIKGTEYNERKRYAEGDLKEYTQWAQGDVYTVRIETESGLEVDQLSGLYGTEGIKDYINETIGDAEYEAKGKHIGYHTADSEYEVSL